MASDTLTLRSLRLASSLGAAFVLTSGMLTTWPARAGDDGSPFNSMLGFVGIQNNKTEDAIDYRPRPQLVVPPSRDLPQPQGKSARAGDWPVDPDATARHKAAADSRRPAPYVAVSTPANAASMRVKMSDCPVEKPNCETDDNVWEKVKGWFSGYKGEVVLNGVEPNRQYLVEPPVGYRAPVQMTQAPPPPPKNAQQTPSNPPGVQAADANAKAPDTPPQQPAAQKEHFGLW
jgi:hypothetical protein